MKDKRMLKRLATKVKLNQLLKVNNHLKNSKGQLSNQENNNKHYLLRLGKYLNKITNLRHLYLLN